MIMFETPSLTTERLSLLPCSSGHITERYVAWLNDPQVLRFSEHHHKRHAIHTLESCRAYYDSMAASGNPFWAIHFDAEDGRHIGNISAAIDPYNGIADIAILIGDQTAGGKGLGLEAWNAAMNWLLESGDIRKVTAGVMATNAAMMNLIKSSGMKEEGRLMRHFVLGDVETDMVLAAKFAA